MKDVFVGVDPELELIYLGILRKLLETPEKWNEVGYSHNRFRSPYINDDSKLIFRTNCTEYSTYLTKIDIVNGENGVEVHELPIKPFDFKTRKLMKRLYRFMTNRDEWEKSQTANRILKANLGTSFERLQKLLKLKKRIAE